MMKTTMKSNDEKEVNGVNEAPKSGNGIGNFYVASVP
jgi:hypothetical protein